MEIQKFGVPASTFENASGFGKTVSGNTTDKYTFSLDTATLQGGVKGGGPTVSAGPVSLSA